MTDIEETLKRNTKILLKYLNQIHTQHCRHAALTAETDFRSLISEGIETEIKPSF